MILETKNTKFSESKIFLFVLSFRFSFYKKKTKLWTKLFISPVILKAQKKADHIFEMSKINESKTTFKSSCYCHVLWDTLYLSVYLSVYLSFYPPNCTHQNNIDFCKRLGWYLAILGVHILYSTYTIQYIYYTVHILYSTYTIQYIYYTVHIL